MVAISWKKLLLLSGLASEAVCASSKPSTTTAKATITSKPAPSKTTAKPTSCAYSQTTISPTPSSAVCNVAGSLSKPAQIEHLCYDLYRYSFQGQPDCYHSCSRDPRCKSFAWDDFERRCNLYSEPLSKMGFHTNETSLFFSDLRSCYVCDQPELPVQSACPNVYKDVSADQQKKNQCGITGTPTKAQPVAVFDSYWTDFNGCYQSCVDYARSGLCQTFSYGSPSFKEISCRIYNTPISGLGLNVTGDEQSDFSFYSLRGCYECNLPANQTKEDCDASDPPIDPDVPNADFQKTEYNDYLNRTQVSDWGVSYEQGLIAVNEGTKGNIVAAMYNPGRFQQYLGTLYNFDDNPYEEGRFYNVSFEWALPSYKVADRLQGGNCTMAVGPSKDPGLKLTKKLVGTKLQKRGPFLFDASGLGRPGYVQLSVTCHGDNQPGDNVTVWFDNVQFTQHGKVVAGVGSKRK